MRYNEGFSISVTLLKYQSNDKAENNAELSLGKAEKHYPVEICNHEERHKTFGFQQTEYSQSS